MGCTFRARMNQLWSVWYTVAMVLLQVYLLYLGFERYRLYSEMKWPHGAYPRVWLSVYVIAYSVCIPGLLLFAAFGIFKSGNIAGDNDRLGARIERIIEISRKSTSKVRGRCSPLRSAKSIWQHAPPLPQHIHLLMALLQLFAQQVMLAQLYRYGFINSGDFLNTELDFAYQRARQLATNLPMLDNRLQGFRISAHDLSGAPIGPNLLPILMHARLFGIPLEFVNLVIALFAYACSYASVFWRVSKPFSFFFSAHLLVHVITVIWSYLGFSVLYRIQETSYASVRPVGLGQYLSSSRPLKVYHPLAIIATYVTTMMLINIAPIALYTYGYNKYFVNLMTVQYKNSGRNQGTSINGPPSEYSEYRRRSYQKPPVVKLCCDGYAPHITAIVLLVLIVIAKAPTIYALMVLYQHEEKPLLLSCIVVDITYLFTWIIFWLILTLKRDWNFKVVHQVHEIIALQNAHQTMATTAASICDKNPSELKNALILMHGDQMYITDDPMTKQSVLRHAQKNGMGGSIDEVYWLKTNGAQSPTTRKIPLNESAKGTPEMNRLLGGTTVRRQSSDDTPTPAGAYHSIRRTPAVQSSQTNTQTTMMQPLYSTEGSPRDERNPGNTFGTLQRNQRVDYVATLNRQPMTSAQRSAMQNSLNMATIGSSEYGRGQTTQPEAYASIHKSSPRGGPSQMSDSGLTQRRGSTAREDVDNSTYSNINAAYASTYTAYGRTPAQARALQNQQISQQAAAAAGARNASNAYGGQQKFQVSVAQRMPVDGGIPSALSSVRATPVVGEDRIAARATIASREHSPYQRSANLKLSSFNSAVNNADQQKHAAAHASMPPTWSQQRTSAQAIQPPTVQWTSSAAYNKASSISTSSSQQDQCFTPTSTLTSQGSVSNYSSQHTPTPGSPNLGPSHSAAIFTAHSSSGTNARFATAAANSSVYGNIGEDLNGPDLSTYGTITAADRGGVGNSGAPPPPPVAQKPLRTAVATGSTSIRHQVKVVGGGSSTGASRQDDSANYSLTSSNESAENTRQGALLTQTAEYATSIV
uniref:Protein tincar n=1 Tax=Parascaris univalens TaxID=6257 RepID=A0A915C145_PARUN